MAIEDRAADGGLQNAFEGEAQRKVGVEEGGASDQPVLAIIGACKEGGNGVFEVAEIGCRQGNREIRALLIRRFDRCSEGASRGL